MSPVPAPKAMERRGIFAFLCLAAEKDIVVDVKGPPKLMERSVGVTDKRLVTFMGALHGLLCEPVGVRSKVEKEILQWVKRYRS